MAEASNPDDPAIFVGLGSVGRSTTVKPPDLVSVT